MKKQILGLLISSLVVGSAFADEGFLYLKGTKQGEIRGDSLSKGRENLNTVVALDYSTGVTPTNGAGMATGKRIRPPISFTLKLSKATPLLIQAAVTNEVLSEVKYSHWSMNRNASVGGGQTSVTDTIELKNARVLSVNLIDNNGNEAQIDPLVKITLGYQTMTFTHTDGGIIAMDDASGQ